PVERESYLPALMIKTGFSREALIEQIGVRPARNDAPPRDHRASRIAHDQFEPEHVKAEKLLLMLYAQGLCPARLMREDDFSDELNRTIAKWLIGGKSPSAILDELDADQRDRAAGIFQQAVPISPELAGQMAADCVEKIRVKRLEE